MKNESEPCLAHNIEYLDAMCEWAEAIVDHRTAVSFGDDDQGKIDSFEAESRRMIERMQNIADTAAKAGRPVPFESLASKFSLTEEDRAALRLAFIPSLESSFNKRIARFNDNVLHDYVDVDFILGVLFEDRVERLEKMALFLPSSGLVAKRLVNVTPSREASSDTMPSRSVTVPDGVVNFIMGYDHIDKSVAGVCEMTQPNVDRTDVIMDEGVREEALKVVAGSAARVEGRDDAKGVSLGVFGPPGTGKSLFASMVASELHRPLLTVDSAKLASEVGDFPGVLDTLFVDAGMRGAVVAFDRCDALFRTGNPKMPYACSRIEGYCGSTILMTSSPRRLDPSMERYISYQVDIESPDTARREAIWTRQLEDGGPAAADGVDIPALALTFDFSGGQISNAVSVARRLASSRGLNDLGPDDLNSGAWAQVRADMEEYSNKRKSRLTLDDLVLPDREKKSVIEVMDAAKHRTFIMTRWGFGNRLSTGKGLCCMFLGEPGTGKTLCAEILAEELGQKLYQISIPRIMSKYIGETEKNIERIFSTARADNSILLFDEADALFTTRVKVETSVDRFSNMEINLLLQEIERFEGIVLLTTNLEKNMDKAFERRIQFKIRFPVPDKEHRSKIWSTLIPKECPVDEEIDWDLIGESFELTGGHIKNAILRAAYKAAGEKDIIRTDHIVDAAEAECRASGRLFRGLKRDED